MKNKLIELIDALREELTANAYIKIANAIQSLPDDEPTTIPFQWPVPEVYEVVTRDGRKVEQLHKFSGIEFPVTGVMDGKLESWKDNGSYNDVKEHASDLVLRPIERKVWVVEWPDGQVDVHKDFPAGSYPGEIAIYEAILKEVI